MGKETRRRANSARGESAGIGSIQNPLDFIAEDHMREREVCALIDRIVSAASMEDKQFEQILTFLESALPQHLADEEIDLFPLMLKRCDPEDEIERVIGKLQIDHRHAIADAPAIIAVIKACKEPLPKLNDDDSQQMTKFAHHARRHLILENAVILPIARARLTDDDLSTMKRHMLERRGLHNTPAKPT